MKYLYVSLVLLLSVGCCKEVINLQTEDLIGIWRSSEIEIDGISASSLNLSDGIVFMGLQENGSYFHNFNSGLWEVEGDKLILTTNDEIFRDYTVIYSSLDSIVVRTQLVESDYFVDLPNYEADESFEALEYLIKD